MKHAISIAIGLGAVLLAAGCSGNKDSGAQSLPSQTLLPDSDRTSEVQPSPSPPKAPEETLIVIEPGAAEDPRRGLVEASRAERDRRRQVGQPAIVLTDKNLEEFQEGAKLTFVHEEDGAELPNPEARSSTLSELPPTEVGEDYWRDRGRQIRTGWRDAVDRIDKLQGDIIEYRRRFFEEDDPSVRDTLIKPAWDRALDELDKARIEARQQEEDLQKFIDLGYNSGAYDEWLEEGIEIEPTREELDRLSRERNTVQFDEPNIAAENLDPEDLP